MRKMKVLCSLWMIACLFMTGCSNDSGDDSKYPSEYPSSPGYSISDLLLATSPGTAVYQDANVIIDYSNASQGYIRVKRLIDNGVRWKLKLTNNDVPLAEGRENPYYDLNKVGEYETFPLVYGNGSYKIEVKNNTYENYYGTMFDPVIKVDLVSEQTPFLYPNQTVDYDQNTKAIEKAFDLCKDDTNDLQRVKTIYDYIVKNIKYDDDKAEKSQNEYILPILDETLETNKGICFDYAALMAAMCRSQHIPCKVVVGDTEIAYHAWVEVWLEGTGWINPEVLFESEEWTRMDPTFTASKADYDSYYNTSKEY